MDLTRCTCLVTGSNRGIGRALAERLAREPLGLLLCGVRDVARFAPIAAPPGGAREVRPVRIDLSSRESIESSWADLAADERALDVLVNNAGQLVGGLLEDQDLDRIYAMFQVNLVAVVHLTQLALPGMLARRRGLVVNNASISGYPAFPAASTYSATKHGVVAFTESLRRELRGTDVTAMHLVTPGVDTAMLDETEDEVGRHLDTSGWTRIEPEVWADKVVAAMLGGRHIVGPGGRLALAKLASRGPAAVLDLLSARIFSRRPRR